jgi:hypothetical protein
VSCALLFFAARVSAVVPDDVVQALVYKFTTR